MKPFTLHNVLAYKKRLEDISRHRFFEAKKSHQQVEKKLHEEQLLLLELETVTARLQAEGVGITDLIRYEERILQVIANIAAINKNLAEKAEILHRAHQHLVTRAKERQIMERLKEQKNKAWQAYLEKKETMALDEIAILHHDSQEK